MARLSFIASIATRLTFESKEVRAFRAIIRQRNLARLITLRVTSTKESPTEHARELNKATILGVPRGEGRAGRRRRRATEPSISAHISVSYQNTKIARYLHSFQHSHWSKDIAPNRTLEQVVADIPLALELATKKDIQIGHRV